MSAAAARELLVTGVHTREGAAVAHALASDPGVSRVLCVHARGRPLPKGSPRVQHANADLTRYRDVRDLLFGARARHVSVVVHVPAYPSRHKPPRNQPPARVAATQQLLLSCEEHPRIERFVMLSSSTVYRIDTSEPMLIDEDHPLELSPDATEPVRACVAADLVACARIGVSHMRVAVLRGSEILVRGGTGQLHDYLSSRVCLRPLGFDPMLNVLAIEDAAEAARLAALSDVRGVFNVPGSDTLPLSELIFAARRLGVALPGPALVPAYGLRAVTTGFRFRYESERKLLHFGAILDGRRAERQLGYQPRHRVRLAELFGRPRRTQG